MTDADKEYLIQDLEGQLNDLKAMVDSEFKVDLQDEIDPKGFRKEARSEVKTEISAVRGKVKEDRASVSNEFKVPEDTAGPEIKIVDVTTGEETAGDKVFADALDAGSTVEMIFTQVTDTTNTVTGSLTMEID